MNEAIKKIGEYEESRQLMRLADALADFLRRYSEMIPDDRRREDFQRELAYLIHLTYREAQQPLVKQITEFVTAHSRPLMFEVPK